MHEVRRFAVGAGCQGRLAACPTSCVEMWLRARLKRGQVKFGKTTIALFEIAAVG
jgi:Na+-translocating ferredoxin:NAD+ oxidoreductase RNF subunit RnfB